MEGFGLSRCILWMLLAVNSFMHASSRVPQLDILERQKRQIYNPPEFVLGMNSKYNEGGPWGLWTLNSSCSRSCGGGVSFQTRICTDFRRDGKHSCFGPSRRYHSCNIQACPDDKDFRVPQCTRFNGIPFRGSYYSWVPFYGAPNPCELNCMPKGSNYYHRRGRKVIDGTPCYNNETHDICINGQCTPLPCDRILGSETKLDKCGVCGGDDSTCHLISGIVDQEIYTVGYNDILLIPPHATGIIIEEVTPNKNHFAIRNFTGYYYLNGNWQIEFSGTYMIGGAEFHYERNYDLSIPERIWSDGPTLEPLFISLVYQDPARNPSVRYEYTVSVDKELTPTATYGWKTDDYQKCSKTCSGGVQQRPVYCARSTDNSKVEDNLCDIGKKPKHSKECNIQPCPALWHVGEWSQCSQSCASGTQYRLVYCEQLIQGGVLAVTNDQQCEQDDKPKPPFFQICNKDVECPRWHAGPWAACNRICGPGNQTREVTCEKGKQETVVLENSYCDLEKIPDSSRNCTVRPCEGVEWILTEWSGCTDKCGPQRESRQVYCANEKGEVFSDDLCSDKPVPKLSRPCPKAKPCIPLWHTSEWSRCSAKCGTGVQTRVVFCGIWKGDSVRKVADAQCKKEKKFTTLRNCTRTPCKGSWFSGPWTKCSVPCGGGERTRKILCLHKDSVVFASQCDPSTIPHNNETCNDHSCREDVTTESTYKCHESPYGCCPDGKSIAGPNIECPTNVTEDCGPFGCCLDLKTPAQGPFRAGCPDITVCNETKYGCCPDGLTPAKGKLHQGCPGISDCLFSTHGCCSDNVTAAKGPDMRGCPTDDVTKTTAAVQTTASTATTETSAIPTTVSTTASESTAVPSKTRITPTVELTTVTSTMTDVTVPSTVPTTEISDISKSMTTPTSLVTSSATQIITTSSDKKVTTVSATDTMATSTTTETTVTSTVTGDAISTAKGTTIKSDITEAATPISMKSSITEATEASTESTMTSAVTADVTTISAIETTMTSSVTGTTMTMDRMETMTTSGDTRATTTVTPETSTATESTTSSVTAGVTTITATKAAMTSSATGTITTMDKTEALTTSSETQATTAIPETSISTESTTPAVTTSTAKPTSTRETTVMSTVTGTITTSSETQATSHSTTSMTDTTMTTGATGTTITSDTKTTVPSGTTGAITTATETTAESLISTTDLTATDSTRIMTSADETKMTSVFTTVSMQTSDSTSTATSSASEPMSTVTTGTVTTSTAEVMTTPGTTTSTDTTAVTGSRPTSVTDEVTTFSSTMETSLAKTSSATEMTMTTDVTGTTMKAGTETTAESVTGSLSSETTLLVSSGSTETTRTDAQSDSTILSTTEMTASHRTETTSSAESTLLSTTNATLDLTTITLSTTESTLSDNETTEAETSNVTSTAMVDNSSESVLPNNVTASLSSDATTLQLENMTLTTPFLSCNDTEFGCCPDNITVSTIDGSNCDHFGLVADLENNPQQEEPNDSICANHGNSNNKSSLCCENSQYGCCPDNITAATGEGFEGCFKSPPQELRKQSECEKSTYGCCPDGITPSPDDNYIGCPCETFTYGCCDDNMTPRLGPDDEGCCFSSEFGCCPDNKTKAGGENYMACPCFTYELGCCRDNAVPILASKEQDCVCEVSIYGCCEDDYTMPTGPDFEGCVCHEMLFGCCPDNFTAARDPYGEGCRCDESRYGCCPDGQTTAKGLDYYGCPCSTLPFGCCADGKTPAHDKEKTTCPCNSTEFGCCPNKKTHATGPNNEGCPCESKEFGCCADGKTAAIGLFGAGCEDCARLEYGCCPDNKTVAKGRNYGDCPCDTYSYGCCPDGKTPAQGPNKFGCSCGLHGCCPDGKTPAQGPNNFGCSCGVYGCCLDGKTPAQGSNYYGCSCGLYGCCPDGKTPAQGPNNFGCLCGEFGCCPDGFTPARGPNGTDCPCNTQSFGCCPDNRTAAMGPNYFGCSCKTMIYGCCSDGITPAKGPKEAGCSCESSQYGCCPDSRTYAKGQNNSGCPCSSFPYGCCPDNHTAATGPSNAGCSCRTMLHGCCYDGVTVAEGPNYEGCPCNTSQYGCCQDGKTPAAGKNYKGCACRNTQFGCCADGYTAANGPNYEGCPVTDSTGNFITDRCSVASEIGPCHNYSVKWHFKNGICERFWYGGCEGNANRFNTEKDCHDSCFTPPAKVTDIPTDICRLPKKEGNCMAAVVRWFYDYQSQNCQQFYYSGCEGNENRFDLLVECETRCSPNKGRDLCQLPLEAGNCGDFREKWYYDSTSGECKAFYYSGCGGNDNNFDSHVACFTRCNKLPATDHPTEEFKIEHCLLDKDIGPCPNSELRWYYEKSSGVCREFFYGGCQGNPNRFQSHRQCETKCTDSQDICKLPQIRGNCNMAIEYWYYNYEEDVCEEFIFTGCQGNANKFSDKEACEKRCKPSGKSTTAPSQDRCSLPKDPGPCVGQHTAWYYDVRLNACRKFIYGGCDGNSNRFVARKNCELLCVKKPPKEHHSTAAPPPESNTDVCQMPPVHGDCHEVIQQFFYDAKNKVCLPFIYSGCGGNKNHFKTEQICMKFCSNLTSSVSVPDVKRKDELCPASNCDELRCPLGKDEKIDDRGCVYCHCFNPCEIHVCAEDSRCAIEMYRTTDGEPRAQPLCRLMNKPGKCPAVESKAADPYASECVERCRLDSDCRNDRKCCFNGCTNVCMDPVHEIVDSEHHFDQPTEQDIIVKIGDPVFLVCPAIPSMSYHWSKNNASLPDDDPHIQILHNGTVYISNAEEYDTSTFVCTTPGSTGSHIQHKFNLQVQAPARILPGPILVLVQLTQPATLQCKAIGHPQPIVTWWREQRMLPMSSSRYQQYPDYSLLIRSVTFPDAGIYTCQAYNGIGPMAILAVTVRFSHSSDVADSIDFFNNPDGAYNHNNDSGGDRLKENPSTYSPTSKAMISSRKIIHNTGSDVVPTSTPHPLSPTSMVSKAEIIGGPNLYVNSGSTLNLTCVLTQTSLPPAHIFWYHNGNLVNYDSRQGVNIQTEKSFHTTSTLFINTAQPIDSGNYSCVPSNADPANITVHVLNADLSVEINEITPTPKIGNFVQLDCIASGPPSLTVTWYFNNNVVQENDRIRILQNNTLIISDIQTSQNGHYQCVARDYENEASASVTIAVKDDVPEDCVDNQSFGDCELLVKAHYCVNAVFAYYCCRSCTLAGHPPKS